MCVCVLHYEQKEKNSKVNLEMVIEIDYCSDRRRCDHFIFLTKVFGLG